MSLLLEQQMQFMELVPKLILKALEMGYRLTSGDAFRDPRSHGALGVQGVYGEPNSCHKLRMAIDLNLFKDGKFLASTEDHRALGEWWEKQHPKARWGGRFKDGNHYSLEYDGHK